MLDINSVRKEFPILKKKIRGKPLCYLDNGASAQKPKVVIDTISKAEWDDTPESVKQLVRQLSGILKVVVIE